MEKTRFDYSKLLGKIREAGYTQTELAKAIGCAEATLNLKLKNVREFKLSEAKKICDVLNIDTTRIAEYFFCIKTCEKAS